MRRAAGWTRLAGIALELSALAFIGYVVMDREDRDTLTLRRGSAAEVSRPAETPAAETPPAPTVFSEPMDFLGEPADERAQYFRAVADGVELLAAIYSDGRIRLASGDLRFAGMLQGAHADLLELDNNQWSEVFLRTTPAGTMQLELRGGPYDARVLTCETLNA